MFQMLQYISFTLIEPNKKSGASPVIYTLHIEQQRLVYRVCQQLLYWNFYLSNHVMTTPSRRKWKNTKPKTHTNEKN